MNISHWLIGLPLLAIIAAVFARSIGEVRPEQSPRPVDAEYSPAVSDEQPHDVMMSEDQQELKQLLDARADAQHQLDILVTGLIRGGGPAADRLKATLAEFDQRIAELQSDRP
jgi:hypothetical protein